MADEQTGTATAPTEEATTTPAVDPTNNALIEQYRTSTAKMMQRQGEMTEAFNTIVGKWEAEARAIVAKLAGDEVSASEATGDLNTLIANMTTVKNIGIHNLYGALQPPQTGTNPNALPSDHAVNPDNVHMGEDGTPVVSTTTPSNAVADPSKPSTSAAPVDNSNPTGAIPKVDAGAKTDEQPAA